MKYSFAKYEAVVNSVEPSFMNRTSAENWVLLRIQTLSENWLNYASEEEIIQAFMEALKAEKDFVREYGCEPGSVLTSLIID